MNADHLRALLSRVALGDREAFRSLYTETSAKLFGVLLRLLKNRHDAEDALQMVYVKIWQKAPAFAGSQHSPMGWLVVLTRNHAIDLMRTRLLQHLLMMCLSLLIQQRTPSKRH